MQAWLILFRVRLVTNVFAHFMIWMNFVIVVPANAQDAILVKNKSCMKTAAILFVWL
jgi:hypothetical protein